MAPLVLRVAGPCFQTVAAAKAGTGTARSSRCQSPFSLGGCSLPIVFAGIKEISPKNVQIYTLDRGYPSDKIFPLDYEIMLDIKEMLAVDGIAAEVY